jgi:hypothetical protein
MDLHYRTWTHVELGVRFAFSERPATGPTMQSEQVSLSICPFWLEQYFLVMTIHCRIGNSVDIGKGFWVRKVS